MEKASSHKAHIFLLVGGENQDTSPLVLLDVGNHVLFQLLIHACEGFVHDEKMGGGKKGFL